MDRRHMLIGGGSLAVVAGVAALGVRQTGSSANYDTAEQTLRATLPARPADRDLIRYATLAPNSHNTQAWRFAAGPGTITIHPDFARRTPIVDPDDHHLFVTLGCAAENFALAAAARGMAGDLAFDPATQSIAFAHRPSAPRPSPMFDAIPHRQSTRAEFDGRPVESDTLIKLQVAAAIPGVDTVLITDRPRIDRIRDLVIAGNSGNWPTPPSSTSSKSGFASAPATRSTRAMACTRRPAAIPNFPNGSGSARSTCSSPPNRKMKNMPISSIHRPGSSCFPVSAKIANIGSGSAAPASGSRSRRPRLA